jgi:hypothetical protein
MARAVSPGDLEFSSYAPISSGSNRSIQTGKTGITPSQRPLFRHPDHDLWRLNNVSDVYISRNRDIKHRCASRRLVSSFCVEVTENPITGTLCLTEVDLEIVDASFRLNAFEQCAKKWDELLGRPESSGRHKGLGWPLCTK